MGSALRKVLCFGHKWSIDVNRFNSAKINVGHFVLEMSFIIIKILELPAVNGCYENGDHVLMKVALRMLRDNDGCQRNAFNDELAVTNY
jgi:hypothetical protein